MTHATAPVLDHVVVNVGNQLDDAQNIYRRLGFTLTERGHHSLGTSNHLAIFGENYLELLGFLGSDKSPRPDLVDAPPGLHGLVFKVTDSIALASDLATRALLEAAPAEFRRPVRIETGVEDARFRTVKIRSDLVQNGRVFFCHHFTPHLVWRNEWRSHPNGVTDIVGFVISAPLPEKSAALYEQIFDTPLLANDDKGNVSFNAGRARVSLLQPAYARSQFGSIASANDEQGAEADRMVALVLATRSLKQTAGTLAQSEIPCTELPDGSILVEAHHAAGVALKFVSQGSAAGHGAQQTSATGNP
jgi:hypothetical protein